MSVIQPDTFSFRLPFIHRELLYVRLFHKQGDQKSDHASINGPDSVCPTPARWVVRRKNLTVFHEIYLCRATRKPNANGDKNGETRKPIVQMLSLNAAVAVN